MNHDARVTLYGGAAIGIALYLLGAAINTLIGVTGLAMMGVTLVLAATFDRLLPPDSSA